LARAELEAIVGMMPAPPSFVAALRGPRLAVIAELKRRSPSKGTLDESLSATTRTRTYADSGAAALSILTEPARFGGSLSDLRDARAAVSIPLLRKDFITDQIQLLEARAYGASAALLIARALAPTRLAELARAARAMGLTPLIEVRDEAELADAVAVEGAVIGVNNRDLETLVIEPAVGARLIPLVPADRIAVYESGIAGRDDAARAAELGADAILVGSALSVAQNPSELLTSLTAPARHRRG
jgi:indole-3-glycerol phosphate synthase